MPEVDLSEDEVDAVRLAGRETVDSSGAFEFSLRAGCSTTEALAVLTCLAAP